MSLATSIPLLISAVGLEYAYSAARKKPFYKRNDALSNLVLGLSYVCVSLFTGYFIYQIYTWLTQFSVIHLPRTVWTFVLLMVLDDLINYWVHRLSHETRFFWAVHETHHSSPEYNFTTAARLSFTTLLTTWPFWLILPLLGFPPEWILIQQGISHIYGIFTHTQTIRRLGLLEKVFTTPSHHRVHHGSDVKYLDRNYGIMLIVWDKIFGSFQIEEETPTFGIMHPIGTDNPVKILAHPWILLTKDVWNAPTLREKILYLLKPPGWNHYGTGRTARQLQGDLSFSS